MPDMDMAAALDPFVAAALRQRRGVMPEGGRQAGPATHVLENYLPHVGANLAKTVMAPGEVMKGGDPTKGLSEESTEGMIPQALALSSLGPAASAPMAMAGSLTKDPMLAALYLQRRKGGNYDDDFNRRYYLRDEGGERVGNMNTTYNPRVQDVYVDSLNSSKKSPFLGDPAKEAALNSNGSSFSFGPRDVRSLMMGLRGEFPEAQTISGYRVSGARDAANSVGSYNPNFTVMEANAQGRLPQFTPEQLAAYRAKAPAPESIAAAQAREAQEMLERTRAWSEQQRAREEVLRPQRRDPAHLQEEELMQALRRDREVRDAERQLQTRFGQAEGQVSGGYGPLQSPAALEAEFVRDMQARQPSARERAMQDPMVRRMVEEHEARERARAQMPGGYGQTVGRRVPTSEDMEAIQQLLESPNRGRWTE